MRWPTREPGAGGAGLQRARGAVPQDHDDERAEWQQRFAGTRTDGAGRGPKSLGRLSPHRQPFRLAASIAARRPPSSRAPSAAASPCSAAILRPARRSVTCGRIARMPPARGAIPSNRRSGFSQITRRDDRRRRSMAAASAGGIVTLQPVGDQKDDGPLPHHPRATVAVEGGKAGPIRVPPVPVCASAPAKRQCRIHVAPLQGAGMFRQPRAKVNDGPAPSPARAGFATACRKIAAPPGCRRPSSPRSRKARPVRHALTGALRAGRKTSPPVPMLARSVRRRSIRWPPPATAGAKEAAARAG